MKVKIPRLIFSGIGIKSNTKATICGEQARSEYVVARGGCVASADLCGEQEKCERIAEGGGASNINFQLDHSLRNILDCHCSSLQVMAGFNLSDVSGSSLSPLGSTSRFLFPMSYAVSIKHAGKVYQLALDPSQPPAAFKQSIYEACGVPPDRQKVMVKGGVLKVNQRTLWLYWVLKMYPIVLGRHGLVEDRS